MALDLFTPFVFSLFDPTHELQTTIISIYFPMNSVRNMNNTFGEQCLLDVKNQQKKTNDNDNDNVMTTSRVYVETRPPKSGALRPCRNYSIN